MRHPIVPSLSWITSKLGNTIHLVNGKRSALRFKHCWPVEANANMQL